MPTAVSGRDMTMLLVALVAALFVYDLHWLAVGMSQPLLDLHEFRQTPTAIAADWIAEGGGPPVACETPILGTPWTIPFEFPVCQWMVALVWFTGLGIDLAGRFVSIGFVIACLWPMRMLFRQFRLPDTAFLFGPHPFLPHRHAFWSRTFGKLR